MNIYEIEEIKNEIEIIAEANEGEIPEEKFNELMKKETDVLVQIDKLVKYIKHLELFTQSAFTEIDRIRALSVQAKNRMSNIKRYLIPYIEKKGKIDVGTFKLSVRNSEAVIINDELFNITKTNKKYKRIIPETREPDKMLIRQALKAGKNVPGAFLDTNKSLQIK